MTQPEKVLNYLKNHHTCTTNELRANLMIVDVPKAVSILIRRGFDITAKRNQDNTSTYYYNHEPNPSLSHYAYEGTNAVVHQGLEGNCKICHKESEQLSI